MNSNKLKSSIVLVFFGIIAYLTLASLQIGKFNFWMDNSGLLDIKNNFLKHLYLWDNNALGSFSFSIPSSLPNYLYTKIIYSIFGLEYGTYFGLYFFVFFALFSGYLLLRKLSLDRIQSSLIALLFVINPVFLYYLFSTGTTTLLMAYVGVILSIAYTHDYLEHNKISSLAKLILASILVSHPFIFVFFCVTLLYIFVVNKRYKALFFLGIPLLLINFYWILPFLTAHYFKEGQLLGSYTPDLIGSYAKLGQFQYSFLFLGRSFGFLEQLYRYHYVVYIEMFLIWIALIYAIFWDIGKSIVVRYYWFYVLFLLMFSVGPRGELGSIFRYLLNNFSFFSLFRSYQNVFVVLMVFIFYLFFLSFKKNTNFLKLVQYLSVFFFIFFVLFQNLSFTERSSNFPNEYFEVKEIVDKDEGLNRVLLLPYSTYDYYGWDNPTEDKYFLQYFFNKSGLVFYRPTIDSPVLKKLYDKIYSGEDYKDDLYRLGIGYILNRKDLTKADKGYFRPLGKTIPGKLIFSTDNIDLYSLKSYRPTISGDDISFSRQSPIYYKMSIKGLSKNQKTISFLESFQSGWGLYLNKYNSSELCNNPQYFAKENTNECQLQQKFFEGEEFPYLWKKPIFNDKHKIINHYANGWAIDSNYIKQNFSKEDYQENPDGSIDVELVLYFKPQSYFYLGLIISVTTLIGCLGYLAYDLIKRRRKTKDVAIANDESCIIP